MCCHKDLPRAITVRRDTVGLRLAQERTALKSLAERWETGAPPTQWVRSRAWRRAAEPLLRAAWLIGYGERLVRADEIVVAHGGKVVAVHERASDRLDVRAQLGALP